MRSVLVPLPPVHWGGLQAFAANLNVGLRDAGWKWTVVIPPEATEVQERLRAAGVEVLSHPLVRFRLQPLLTLKALAALPENIRSLAKTKAAAEASIIQAVGGHHLHGPMLAAKLRKPLVWQLHGVSMPGVFRKAISPFISARADAIMTNGWASAKGFWGNRPLRRPHFVFYAPIDAGKYAPNEEARRAARRELGCDENTVLIGTVGNHVKVKNHEFLMDAARQLLQMPNVGFAIFGADFAAYRNEYEAGVKRPAAELNARRPDYIQFRDPGERVHYWLQALDIFVLTSHAEGAPLVVFEAMSAGKPVVSANVGSIAEIVEQGKTGLLYFAGDLNGFTSHLTRLCGDRLSRQSMAAAGLRRIVQEFSLQQVVQAHVSAYETALECHSRKRSQGKVAFDV